MTLGAFSLLAAACGGGKGSEQKTPAETSAPTLVREGAGRDLAALLDRGLGTTFKVTYETTLLEGGKGDTYLVYNSPPQTRIDTIPAEATTAESIIIGGDKDTKTISCSLRPDAWACTNIPPLGDSLLSSAGPFIYPAATGLASHEVLETEPKTFAGQSARCFRILPTAPDDEPIDSCFNNEGVPLYSAPLFGIVQAVQFSTQVVPEDFAPPVAPH